MSNAECEMASSDSAGHFFAHARDFNIKGGRFAYIGGDSVTTMGQPRTVIDDDSHDSRGSSTSPLCAIIITGQSTFCSHF